MYIVVEIQKNADGTVGTLVDSFADINSAENKFHTVLAYAAVSALPVHSCILFTEEGFPLRHECYKHDGAPAPVEAEEE